MIKINCGTDCLNLNSVLLLKVLHVCVCRGGGNCWCIFHERLSQREVLIVHGVAMLISETLQSICNPGLKKENRTAEMITSLLTSYTPYKIKS